MRSRLLLWVAGVCLFGCGGGAGPDRDDDDDGNPNGPGGSIVYSYVASIGGSLEEAVHIFDVAAGTERVFRADDDLEGGLGVARDGTVAQLGELDDAVRITVSRADGSLLTSFTVAEELSFATSGAAIAPDASLVAFSLDVDFGETRGPRTYLCQVASPHACATFDLIDGPSFAPDGRVLAVDEDGTSIFVSNAARTRFDRLDTPLLDTAENPIMTNDGRYVIFDSGAVSHLDIVDLTSGVIRPLTRNGIAQFYAALSPDNAYLLFEQKCCGGEIGVPTLYVVPFEPNATLSAAYGDLEPLLDALGDPVSASGRPGWY